MRKLILFSLVCLGILNACSSSKSVIKKTTTHNYRNLRFQPETVTKQIANNIEVTITPIDAKNLNEETYSAAYRDGNYEKEFMSSSIEVWRNQLKSTSKSDRLSKSDRIWLQGKINAFDYLDKVEKEGKIPQQLAFLLKRRIVNDALGKDGSEIESLSDINDFPDDFNPYKINKNYFSVFKVSFINKGSELESIKQKEFQFVSSEEQLYPLTSEYLENNLKDFTETIKNAYRLNMPTELTITPGQRITKYLAIPAINTQNKSLQVQFIREKKAVNFDYTVATENKNKTYHLENYTFGYGRDGNAGIKNFFVISYQNNVYFSLRADNIFVNEEKKQMPVSVYAIAIDHTDSNISFGSALDFTFGSVKKNKKVIDFYKVKKKDLKN